MQRPHLLLLFCICIFYCCNYSYAQEGKPESIISTDLVYDAEMIPMIGYEHFYAKHGKMNSWHIDASYQISYNNEFGLPLNNIGDDVSVGVYHGPAAKFGYTHFTKWNDRKWKNYYSPTLGVKYLSYNNVEVYTGNSYPQPYSRTQSEKCVELVPQFYVG